MQFISTPIAVRRGHLHFKDLLSTLRHVFPTIYVLIPFVLIHKLLMPISWMRTWQVQTAGNVPLISLEPTDGYLATQEGRADFVPTVLFIDLASQ